MAVSRVGKWLAKDRLVELSSPDFHVIDIIEFRKPKPYQNKNLLHQKYVVEKLSVKKISEHFFCSTSTVLDALRRFDIPLRENRPGPSRVEHLMYGKKLEKGKTVESLSEMRVVKAILAFSDDGMSLRQICRFLEATGVPTKTRKSKWHPTMVNRILSHYTKEKGLPAPSQISVRTLAEQA